MQDCIKRVKLAFERWFKGDKNGKRSGKPRFKGIGRSLGARSLASFADAGSHRYRSFTFPQVKQNCLTGKWIVLPKIGQFKLIQHRPLPEGFAIKTVTITRKANGYYITLSLEDRSIPNFTPNIKPNLEQ